MNRHLAKTAAVLVAAATMTAGLMHVANSQYNTGDRYDHNNRYNDNRYDNNNNRYENQGRWSRNMTIRAGTPIDVRLDSKISTEDNSSGDAWTGTVFRDVVSPSGRRVLIPRGTQVEGVVTYAEQGGHGNNGRLDLAVRSIEMNGDMRRLNASTEPIVADTKRSKQIGATIGGAAVGGILGHAIGGDKGGILGGLLGGAAGYSATRHSGRTMSLRPGTVITFTTTQDMLAYR